MARDSTALEHFRSMRVRRRSVERRVPWPVLPTSITLGARSECNPNHAPTGEILMTRIFSTSRVLFASSIALSLASPSALAGGGCGTDGQILDRADLLSRLGGNAVQEDFEAFSIAAGQAVNLDVFCL